MDERQRFEHAVVRAGVSSVPNDNARCGRQVTLYQAVANNWMEFTCSPPARRTARYVSVDIPRTTYLALCEVIVLPCDLPQGNALCRMLKYILVYQNLHSSSNSVEHVFPRK